MTMKQEFHVTTYQQPYFIQRRIFMELYIILCFTTSIMISFTVKAVLKKDIKKLKVKANFIKGFEFSCSFYKHKDSK